MIIGDRMHFDPSKNQGGLSVIVPCFNSNINWLVECLSSVYAALLECGGAWEILVVDDGSEELIQSKVVPLLPEPIACSIRFLRQSNAGLSAARNAGIREASGEWCHFIDDDDMVLSSFYQEMLKPSSSDGVDLVLSQSSFFGGSEQAFEVVSSPHVAAQLVVGNVVHVNAVLVKRDVLVRSGLFDETLNGLEDWDMWLRCLRVGAQLAVVQKSLARVRIHPGSMSTNRHRMNSRMAELSIREWDHHFDFWQAKFPPESNFTRSWALAGLTYAWMSELPWRCSLQFRKSIAERVGNAMSWMWWGRQGVKHLLMTESSNHAEV